MTEPVTATASPEETLQSQFQQLLEQLSNMKTQVVTLTNTVKTLQKETNRNLRVLAKSKKNKSSNRAPSGFAKPCPLSEELCVFMGVEKGTEKARTEVTKFLTQYIKEHNLQNSQNRRNINPDEKLTTLLHLSKTDSLTYFNLQKFLKIHFTAAQS